MPDHTAAERRKNRRIGPRVSPTLARLRVAELKRDLKLGQSSGHKRKAS